MAAPQNYLIAVPDPAALRVRAESACKASADDRTRDARPALPSIPRAVKGDLYRVPRASLNGEIYSDPIHDLNNFRRNAQATNREIRDMATLTFRWTGNGIARLTTAAHALADNDKRRRAFRRAINDTPATRRSRAPGASFQGSSARRNRSSLDMEAAQSEGLGATLEYLIIAKGGPIPAKHFRPNQTKKGVSASLSLETPPTVSVRIHRRIARRTRVLEYARMERDERALQ